MATLGVIVGNRDFFPDILVQEARRDLARLFAEMGITPIWLDETVTKLGGVETWEDAQKCAALFKAHADEIEGILVSLPNFGDERGVADTIKLAGLRVPILVQAYPDDLSQLNVERRRDAFCGKISVCNNLKQYGFPFTLTELHTVAPLSEAFRADLARFLGVCRVVKGLKTVRVGAVGARPGAFNTVRYSEKLLQAYGISVITVDLSEILGHAEKLGDDCAQVKAKLEAFRAYVPTARVPSQPLLQMAKFAAAMEDWMAANSIAVTAVQCWTSLQNNWGCMACSTMSMMSERLMPSACEVDVTGALSMYALQLATGKPSALVDWNNNYGDDPDKCVLFHCSDWPKSLLCGAEMAYGEILGTTLGADHTWGTIAGRVPAGPMSYARITTDDWNGIIRTYVGEGRFTDDPLETFGGRAVVEVPHLQSLLKYICKNGFEHHCAINPAPSAEILAEAFETYFGWDVYHHS